MKITGPRVIVTVHPDGTATTAVKDVQGGNCKLASRGFESLFGNTLSMVETADAFEDPEKVEIKQEATL
jgi:hypothetical protein